MSHCFGQLPRVLVPVSVSFSASLHACTEGHFASLLTPFSARQFQPEIPLPNPLLCNHLALRRIGFPLVVPRPQIWYITVCILEGFGRLGKRGFSRCFGLF